MRVSNSIDQYWLGCVNGRNDIEFPKTHNLIYSDFIFEMQ